MNVGPIYLIEASGFAYRAFFGRPAMTATDGRPANAVVGFLELVTELIKEVPASAGIGMVFDVDERGRTWRHEVYPEYKAHRDARPADMMSQMPLLRAATEVLGLPVLEAPGYEADDLIASYAVAANHAGRHVTIVSTDKDMMQLVSDGRIIMFDHMKKKLIDEAAVVEKFGVHPRYLNDFFALVGDKVDNVPGVHLIGEKSAAELVGSLGDLENVLADGPAMLTKKRRASLMAQKDFARLSKVLVTLSTDVPLPMPIDALPRFSPDLERLQKFCDWLGHNYVPKAIEEMLR